MGTQIITERRNKKSIKFYDAVKFIKDNCKEAMSKARSYFVHHLKYRERETYCSQRTVLTLEMLLPQVSLISCVMNRQCSHLKCSFQRCLFKLCCECTNCPLTTMCLNIEHSQHNLTQLIDYNMSEYFTFITLNASPVEGAFPV